MKVFVDRVQSEEQEKAVLYVANMDENIAAAITILENGEKMLVGKKDGEKVPVRMQDIYYVESIDEKSFVYTKK